jgi:hypothetical protein
MASFADIDGTERCGQLSSTYRFNPPDERVSGSASSAMRMTYQFA